MFLSMSDKDPLPSQVGVDVLHHHFNKWCVAKHLSFFFAKPEIKAYFCGFSIYGNFIQVLVAGKLSDAVSLHSWETMWTEIAMCNGENFSGSLMCLPGMFGGRISG